MKLPSAIYLLVLLHLARSEREYDSLDSLTFSDLRAAKCDNQVNSLINTDKDSPCIVAARLLSPCKLGSDDFLKSNSCTCNLVFYNLVSACSSLCLHQGLIKYEEWTDNCEHIHVTDDYPFKDKGGNSIPEWARVPLTSTGVFNTAAAFSKTDNKRWTTLQKLSPVIAVFSVIALGLLTWFIYSRYHRLSHGRKAQHVMDVSPFHHSRVHDRSNSQNSFDSTSHLTDSKSSNGGVHFHRVWIFFGGIFNSMSTVRDKRRNTDWAIDEEHAEQYDLNDPTRRYQSPPRDSVINNGVEANSPEEDSFPTPNRSNRPNSPHMQRSTSTKWSLEWLHKLGLGGAGSHFTIALPKGSDYKSANVKPLQRKSGFMIDADQAAGTGLLHGYHNDPSGSSSVRNQLGSASPPPLRVVRAGTNDRLDHASTIGAINGEVILISRTPGVNFPSEEDEPIASNEIQSPLRPNRVGHIVAEPNHLSPSSQPSPNPSSNIQSTEHLSSPSLPYHQAVSAFGSVERLFPPTFSPNGSNPAFHPSAEQIDQIIHPSRTDPTSLFPASVRAAGYLVPNPATRSPAVSTTSRRDDAASALTYASTSAVVLPLPPPPAPTPPPSVPTPMLPPYSRGPSRTTTRSDTGEPLPPYQTPPPTRQRHPRIKVNTERDAPERQRALAVEINSPSSTRVEISPGLPTMTMTWSAGDGPRSEAQYTPYASSDLLPLSSAGERPARRRPGSPLS